MEVNLRFYKNESTTMVLSFDFVKKNTRYNCLLHFDGSVGILSGIQKKETKNKANVMLVFLVLAFYVIKSTHKIKIFVKNKTL